MRLGVPDAEQLVAFGGLGLGDLGVRVARGGVDALAEVLAEPPLGGVLGEGMRLIVRKERPHPGAQLRRTDADGMRLIVRKDSS